ncbi:MAG: hypothetical protein JKX92_13080 [Porticoccaceae bacterium]|nr:hypothetical protein [Porticoccaceae bacterium]
MKKIPLTLLLVTSLSTLAVPAIAASELNSLSLAAYTVNLMGNQASGSMENKNLKTRTGLKDSLHKKCLTGELEKNTSVEKASAICQDFMSAMTKPRKLSVIDFMWLQMTMKTITSKTATMDEKKAANHGLIALIKNKPSPH